MPLHVSLYDSIICLKISFFRDSEKLILNSTQRDLIVSVIRKELSWIIKKKVSWDGSSIDLRSAFIEFKLNFSKLSIKTIFKSLEKVDLLKNFNKFLTCSILICPLDISLLIVKKLDGEYLQESSNGFSFYE